MCKTISPEFTTYWDFPILIVPRPTGLTKQLEFLEACASALAMYREALTQASDLGAQFTGGSGERTVQPMVVSAPKLGCRQLVLVPALFVRY